MAELPFARLPRLDRLKAAGKYDATEEPESEEEGEGEEGIKSSEGGKKELKERVKKKMRGKNKSMKRLVFLHFQFKWSFAKSILCRYLRKHRKNVIDPQTVRLLSNTSTERATDARACRSRYAQSSTSNAKKGCVSLPPLMGKIQMVAGNPVSSIASAEKRSSVLLSSLFCTHYMCHFAFLIVFLESRMTFSGRPGCDGICDGRVATRDATFR